MNPVSEMKASSTGDGAGSKPLRDRPSLLGTLWESNKVMVTVLNGAVEPVCPPYPRQATSNAYIRRIRTWIDGTISSPLISYTDKSRTGTIQVAKRGAVSLSTSSSPERWVGVLRHTKGWSSWLLVRIHNLRIQDRHHWLQLREAGWRVSCAGPAPDRQPALPARTSPAAGQSQASVIRPSTMPPSKRTVLRHIGGCYSNSSPPPRACPQMRAMSDVPKDPMLIFVAVSHTSRAPQEASAGNNVKSENQRQRATNCPELFCSGGSYGTDGWRCHEMTGQGCRTPASKLPCLTHSQTFSVGDRPAWPPHAPCQSLLHSSAATRPR